MRVLFTAAFLPAAVAAAAGPVITHVEHGPNAPAQLKKHYVVLVSLDGFGADDAKRYGAPHLDAIAEHGASAPQGMIPSYPLEALPNHYALVTGLYPEHHGMVAMRFYDPARRQRYAFDDPATATDGSWYRGVPLWSLAEKQGMRTAGLRWPGSEAEIAGERPSDYARFGEHMSDEAAVAQIASWLRLPDAQRPHFIALRYLNIEHAGQVFGPDAPQMRDAVHRADEFIGKLQARLQTLHLPIDLIVVSDHGMQAQQGDWITLDTYVDLSHMEIAGSLLYAKDESAAEAVYQKLKIVDGRFKVYRRSKVPAALEYSGDPRIGDPVVVPNGPYAIRAHAPEDAGSSSASVAVSRKSGADSTASGDDPRAAEPIRAIFYAEGPDIRSAVRLRPFENVNVYPFLAAILGLDASPTDGSAPVLSRALIAPPAP
ncbi:MAG: ectonucleotide pyrophosphatase/phosphodiesterase [Acidobacteriaceae bacterium]